ncbi:MAG: hypothetical protein AAFO91_15725, partial [Bacteroidota bacterium]
MSDLYDPNSVEMRLPDTPVKEVEETKAQIPLMPIILFGLVLILIGLLGGLLWWGSTFFMTPAIVTPEPIITRPTAEENNEPESSNAEAEVDVLNALSTSNELSAIESDLFGTEIDSLDKELQA